ncbi:MULTISPECIES: imidazole glycerol phosphate synthase subunit HisH [Caproicibacterium]|uniref:Imidazole glycerol phosphate synthase subunit HisH n=1 Tax=Caproicibacterium argilliputei TaxID=3030016 RepID=A0AA97H3F8_9FIRM|nr:imidazole glycerol phosphate synthase subunit HisH [Caproicibacterium argilliputei]WOC33182.1 imidazole glycerol phosphate synthase subunit HisH [Caproicibacterium argilliputei]
MLNYLTKAERGVTMIAVIDYGAGNLQSVRKALEFIGCSVQVTADPAVLRAADGVVLPGVGAFGDAMAHLKAAGLVNAVYDLAESEKPFLGICLGLQLLFESSEEAPGVPGLGIFRGKICRIPAQPGLKIPHMGWNSLTIRDSSGLFQGLPPQPYVYFVHSYYLKAAYPKEVSATTQYGVEIDAAVHRGSLYAMQFHPEKSGRVGLQILRNFAALTGKEG